MKEIVYVVYHDLNTEARSNEFLQCISNIGNVHIVTLNKPKGYEDLDTYLIDKSSSIALFKLLVTAKKVIKKINPDIVLLHDNDCSALIPFIKKNLPNTIILYDSSELYIKEKTEHYNPNKERFYGDDGLLIWIKNKLTFFRGYCERKYLKNVDIIFAANAERAKKMQEYYSLKEQPQIYDNMHRIDEEYDSDKCKIKFHNCFVPSGFNILFGGGISTSRGTFEYIKAFSLLKGNYHLVIAGGASDTELKRYNQLIQKLELEDKISYVGFVSRAEFRYIIKNCQASVIMFSYDNYNSFYCASGKMYESLFEGVPILTSENPPLKRLCDEKQVGIACDNYAKAIENMQEHYSYYLDNVSRYIKELDYDNRINRLEKIIRQRI